ncbi:MAG: magnesium transporter CorA family protein [Nanoarchaeota archaeon]|nr:magnesium transporter CorA family protein [Nanoarchaeota archaeon]
MIKYYKKLLKDKELRELQEFERGSWISVIEPTEEELDFLAEKFKLDRPNLVSGLDRNELPRVEFIEEEFYVILKTMPSADKDYLFTFLIVVGEEFILTLTKYKSPVIDRIMAGHDDFTTSQKLKCLITVLSMINQDFEKATLHIVKSVNSKRESIEELTEKDITDLMDNESKLNNFLSAYYYVNLIYQRIVKKIKFFEEDKEILKDLIIETQQGLDLCRSSLQSISNIRHHFEILMSNKLNKVITILTLFTVIITIPAAISGLFGMNVALPLQNNPYTFYFVLGFIALTWAGSLLYFKKKKFL